MKNPKKNLPMYAFILALALVITQSAFTQKRQDPNWAIHPDTGVIFNLNGKQMDNSEDPAPGTYSCLESGTCAGYFDGPGTPTLEDLDDVVNGRYQEN